MIMAFFDNELYFDETYENELYDSHYLFLNAAAAFVLASMMHGIIYMTIQSCRNIPNLGPHDATA